MANKPQLPAQSKMLVQKHAYVFAPTATGDSALAGELTLTPQGCEFRYASSWYEAQWGYALDPINLPLSPSPHLTPPGSEVFGVFNDATPDSWGERILLLQHQAIPRNIIEKLLRLSGAGVGGITFSLSRTRAKNAPPLPDIALLETLASAIANIDQQTAIPDDILKLISPGSSMGGARPKITLADEHNSPWIVKFSRESDLINYPIAEYATMGLMAKAGITTSEIALQSLSERNVCYMNRRFDREANKGIHFISAHALFNLTKVRSYHNAADDPASYIALARILRKISAVPKDDCAQLFRRMVFNILIGNTDDHALNHAMLYHVSARTWRLSPAYDVLPIISSQGEQSMGVGTQGRASNLSNALSLPDAFGLQQNEAITIAQQVIASLTHWREHFTQCGASAIDVQLLNKVIERNLQQAMAELAN